jgi:long-subunit fatty acid transport protein
LVKNDKTYSINNTSYGLGVNYALNKKLKIRTGVSLVNLDYDTNGILYYQNSSINGKLTNVTTNVPGSLLMIESLSNVTPFFGRPIQKSEGILNQKLGYIEMPLEISYKVLDKKFGIDFIGGMSTMVLNRNEIYLQSSEFNLKIGEANNLNNVHFSGNLGVGFKYGFMKNFEARIEPVFKYQINTFNNDAGNFKPYMFGVYSGINFSF